MMPITRTLAVLAAVACATPAAAETLIVATAKSYGPGLAKDWRVDKKTIVLSLPADTPVSDVAAELAHVLTPWTVQVKGQVIRLTGGETKAMLAKLATTEIESAADLAQLMDMAVEVEVEKISPKKPEGGHSVRAGFPPSATWTSMLVLLPRTPTEPRQEAYFDATVVGAQQQGFPAVVLRLQIDRTRPGSTWVGTVGDSINVSVALPGKGGAVDYDNRLAQDNLGAYFLRPGDRVRAHGAFHGGRVVLDRIERLTP